MCVKVHGTRMYTDVRNARVKHMSVWMFMCVCVLRYMVQECIRE